MSNSMFIGAVVVCCCMGGCVYCIKKADIAQRARTQAQDAENIPLQEKKSVSKNYGAVGTQEVLFKPQSVVKSDESPTAVVPVPYTMVRS